MYTLVISKAFFKVSHDKLLRKLINKNTGSLYLVVELLVFKIMYLCEKGGGAAMSSFVNLCEKGGGSAAMSSFINLMSGVSHGGVLSPVLFCVF